MWKSGFLAKCPKCGGTNIQETDSPRISFESRTLEFSRPTFLIMSLACIDCDSDEAFWEQKFSITPVAYEMEVDT